MIRQTLSVVLPLVLLALSVGCSKKDDSTATPNEVNNKEVVSNTGSSVSVVKDVVNKYHQAILDKNLDAAKAMISSDGSKKTLAAMFEIRSNGMKRGGLPKILKVAINGDAAVVTCKFGPSEQGVDLVKADGAWLIK